jgi:hypothetical protein
MRAGLAILATDTRFVGEQLRRGACGLTYDASRAQSLADQVRALCGDPGRLQQMKENAYRYGQEYCSWESEAWRYRALLREMFVQGQEAEKSPTAVGVFTA